MSTTNAEQNLFAGGSPCIQHLFDPICVTEVSSSECLLLELLKSCENKPLLIHGFLHVVSKN